MKTGDRVKQKSTYWGVTEGTITAISQSIKKDYPTS